MFNVDFPTDTSDIKFRAVQWICTEVLLALAALLNFLPRTWTSECFLLPPLLTRASSPILQMGLLAFSHDRHARLRDERGLAAHRSP